MVRLFPMDAGGAYDVRVEESRQRPNLASPVFVFVTLTFSFLPSNMFTCDSLLTLLGSK
jgi:hypothetical protein